MLRTFGDPVLRQRAREVDELDGDLARLYEKMLETMYDSIGLGLAAPQVGVLRRLYTYDLGDGPAVLINPEIVDAHGEWSYDEGCLSIPDVHIEIVRPKVVTVQGVDLDGKEVVFEGDELMGRLIQHEIDHLDGVLMLDHLDPDRRKAVLREMRRTQFDDAGAARVGAGPSPDDRGRRL